MISDDLPFCDPVVFLLTVWRGLRTCGYSPSLLLAWYLSESVDVSLAIEIDISTFTACDDLLPGRDVILLGCLQ
jgi:hypothetical protein